MYVYVVDFLVLWFPPSDYFSEFMTYARQYDSLEVFCVPLICAGHFAVAWLGFIFGVFHKFAFISRKQYFLCTSHLFFMG